MGTFTAFTLYIYKSQSICNSLNDRSRNRAKRQQRLSLIEVNDETKRNRRHRRLYVVQNYYKTRIHLCCCCCCGVIINWHPLIFCNWPPQKKEKIHPRLFIYWNSLSLSLSFLLWLDKPNRVSPATNNNRRWRLRLRLSPAIPSLLHMLPYTHLYACLLAWMHISTKGV